MILGSEELRPLIWPKEGEGIITNPDPGQKELEGGKYELRLGKLEKASYYNDRFTTVSIPIIGTYSRIICGYTKVALGEHNSYMLRPGFYYQATTLEEVNTPHNLVGRLNQRNTLSKNGIVLVFAVDDCGYRGKLSVGMFVHPGVGVSRIQPGARFLGIQFMPIGNSTAYDGVWQGGKRYNNGEVVEGFKNGE